MPGRAVAAALGLALAVAPAGCGGGSSGPAVVTGAELGNSLAVTAENQYEAQGQFASQVGDQGGSCQGGGAQWICRLEVVQDQNITDLRTYAMTVDRKGCWVATQTGTDVGATGHSIRPDHPDRLRGCVR
jgi:hypothetical protein